MAHLPFIIIITISLPPNSTFSPNSISFLQKNPNFHFLIKINSFFNQAINSMEIGSGSSESSTVEQLTPGNHDYDQSDCDESSELQLGLGLSLGLMGSGQNDGKSSKSGNNSACSSNNSGVVCKSSNNNNTNNIVTVGSKRPASPTSIGQVVGWPPIRSYRMSSMANQAKSIATGDRNCQFDETKGKDSVYGAQDEGNVLSKERGAHKSSLFVKVNMDGVAIGRKVDLTAHSSYESLAHTLEEMFESKFEKELILMPKVTRSSKLLDGTSDLVLTYEDKDGDWMLVGDVPWRMFVTSVKRLKILKTSEANGLPPRFEDRSSKQKSRPI